MRAFGTLALAVFVVLASPALADKGGRHDRERLERAIELGEVLPLARIVELLRAQGITGDILEVELDDDDGGLIYEIYILAPDGRRREIEVDPATGRVLDMDED